MDVRSALQSLEPVASTTNSAGHFSLASDVAASIAPRLCDSRRRTRTAIESEWINFTARYQWQWFATLTFKDAVHPEAAHKRFAQWIKFVDTSRGIAHGRPAYALDRATWLRGLEWQKRGVLHFHALVGNLPVEYSSLQAMTAWGELWLLMGGTGIARVKPIADIGGAAGYVAKYCAKGGEIDISPNLCIPDLADSAS